jgi:hypothetical protein
MLVAWRGLDRSAPLGDEAVLHIVETLQLKMDDGLRAVPTICCPCPVLPKRGNSAAAAGA